MGVHEEHLQKEAAAWDAFLEVVRRVPPGRREEQSVVPGWSVKDLVWHNAGWATFAGDHLKQMELGEFVDPFEGVPDSHWDEVSQRMIEESRGMTFDEVLAGAETARERVRAIWSSMPEIGDEAARWFADETFVHYDEHAEEIRRFIGSS